MPTPAWRQYTVEFSNPVAAEQIAATVLTPALAAAQDDGVLRGWWSVRKYPSWRWRYVADDPSSHLFEDLLETLAVDERIVNWTNGIYEPERLAFGGSAGMHIAHRLPIGGLGPTRLRRPPAEVAARSPDPIQIFRSEPISAREFA
ncbi:thiopeptide-type bacteriocin biosynthesis protein [Micromonospora zamorensis]|uniref:thiopeptide-type bacteriocin biosynthesis protein n=1 Tax=Micromonospora zamorensis TaxID=709883 RepID=UPI002E1C06D6